MEEQTICVQPATSQSFPRMAQLVVEAFPIKFGALFGHRSDLACAIMEEVLRIEHPKGRGAFVAQDHSGVIGTLLLEYAAQPKITRDWRAVLRVVRTHIRPRHLPRLLLGIALLTHNVHPDEAYVESVAVTASARGRGAGTLLLQRAEAWARANSKGYLGLHVSSKNPRARALYARQGFSERRVEKSLLAAIIMGQPAFAYMTKGLGSSS